MGTPNGFPLRIEVTNRAELEAKLDEAEARARLTAMQDRRHGILVTRHDYTSFTVALSDTVPFGITIEHHDP